MGSLCGILAPFTDRRSYRRIAPLISTLPEPRSAALPSQPCVRIAFGTDVGVAPHGENAREFGYMAEAGMSARDCIIAATASASELLGIPEQVGTLGAGKSADIIAVDASPLEDLSELERVSLVMARGAVFKA